MIKYIEFICYILQCNIFIFNIQAVPNNVLQATFSESNEDSELVLFFLSNRLKKICCTLEH